ncbi:Cystathionine gamma-synthase [Prochlorococcus sp. SS52]|nr:Cystathionine gamma-synthase [Prochlorococcus marinus str. LG]KGG18764.1 Cystathionine gamma-synthase [Prochlorococcus marinus str. SS2]KGG23037.1 Cystathionine gamma-synthase [Prochlorococcus marinus str. SS35]KGG36905.1 Cystathionine gamma-synthase [Prochlorococcus sp. SS52]
MLSDPLWEAKHLGQAIPQSPHAVSVALPRWQDVIAYEEKDPYCINALQAIYPRFGFNPLIKLIAKKALVFQENESQSVWPYPNINSAKKAKEYCQKLNSNSEVIIQEFSGLQCLIVDDKATPAAKAFWQHTGLGASSRQAAIALNKEKAPSINEGEAARNSIRKRLAKIYGCNSDLIQLHPSGMAALTTALEALREIRPRKAAFQLGFPYVDVLKLPQVIFDGSELLLNPNPIELAKQLDQKKPSAVIVELPSNPMLKCVDLPLITKMAHDRGIPVIADDTIGSAINIDPLPYADLVFSSLTKSFAGQGDIMAGSLTISPKSPWKEVLKEIIPLVSVSNLSDSDAIALQKASKDVTSRIPELNKACINLKNRLEAHPDVARVLHPAQCPNFQLLMKPNAGFGCLFSFELHGGVSKAERFYNSLKVCKGPSLGTIFTLVCPYVLLAHYNELNWAKQCGVPSSLIRVSVGLEATEDLWDRFQKALNN